MDLVATWDWRAWSLLVLLVVVVGGLVCRWLSGLAFRYLLVGGLARRHGWQVDLPGGDGGRAAFDEQERRRRRQAWALLRKGRIGEGYRTGVFGKTQAGAWHSEITVTGTWRGRQFVASQVRRFELSSGSEGVHRKTRRRSTLRLTCPFPAREMPRWRRRRITADGGGLSVELGPRLRRGSLLAALDHLTTLTDRMP